MQIELASDETGEVFETFEVDDVEFARWEKAAAIEGMSIEDFIRTAILVAAEKYKETPQREAE